MPMAKIEIIAHLPGDYGKIALKHDYLILTECLLIVTPLCILFIILSAKYFKNFLTKSITSPNIPQDWCLKETEKTCNSPTRKRNILKTDTYDTPISYYNLKTIDPRELKFPQESCGQERKGWSSAAQQEKLDPGSDFTWFLWLSDDLAGETKAIAMSGTRPCSKCLTVHSFALYLNLEHSQVPLNINLGNHWTPAFFPLPNATTLNESLFSDCYYFLLWCLVFHLFICLFYFLFVLGFCQLDTR